MHIAKQEPTQPGEGRAVTISGPPDARRKARKAIEESVARTLARDRQVNERLYVDELDLAHRAELFPQFEGGVPTDIELFVQNLPEACQEQHLWGHLHRLGCGDVKEMVLLRRQGKSKGCAYVVFGSHPAAQHARASLNGLHPSSLLPHGAGDPEGPRLLAWFSEAERIARGFHGVYRHDVAGRMHQRVAQIQEAVPDLHKASFVGIGAPEQDGDPRLHLTVAYEDQGASSASDLVDRVAIVWGRLLREAHQEIAAPPSEAPATAWAPPAAAPPTGRAVAQGLRVVLRDSDSNEERHDDMLSGNYVPCGENHGRPSYRRIGAEGGKVFIYYWDARDGRGLQGWWFGASIGGEHVWARSTREAPTPPQLGWQLVAKGATGVELFVYPEQNLSAGSKG